MKKYLMISLTCLLAFSLNAQDDGNYQTLFGQAKFKGIFVSSLSEFGVQGNGLNSAFGGGGGVIFGNVFIGAYGLGTTDFSTLVNSTDQVNLDMAHGGLWLGYTRNSYKLMHLYSGVKLGWGAVDVNLTDSNVNYNDQVFVMTPEIGLEVNVLKILRVAGTVGYRLVDGVDTQNGFRNNEFSGMVAGVTLRFGWFGTARKDKWQWRFWEDCD